MRRILIACYLLCAILALAPCASAVIIETVPVGNPGNAADPLTFNLYGRVTYNYRIGTTEVTVGQYTAFLNAVAATDTYALYNTSMATSLHIAGIKRDGVSGSYTYSVLGSPNKPVTFVSWGDAARFSNWLHNGQPTGAQNANTTEGGAYTLNGATTQAALNAVNRNASATWFIPTENEWYKAAYHQPAALGGDTDNYWQFPTRTNSGPYSDQPPGSDAPTPSNTGNFYRDDGLANLYNDGFAVTGSTSISSTQNYLTDAGAYASSSSFYGTFDQGGNVDEWNEALISSLSSRILRGGAWGSPPGGWDSSHRNFQPPTDENGTFGFRVATIIPEPSTIALATLGAAALGCFAVRRRFKAH